MFEKLMKIQAADIAAQSEYHREEKEAVLARTKELFPAGAGGTGLSVGQGSCRWRHRSD